MYINKWKLLLRDATESVYIGGLCNRFLSVFGTLVFRVLGGAGWGGLTDIFPLGLQQIFAHYILIVFCTKDTCNENGDQPVKVRFCTAYLTPY